MTAQEPPTSSAPEREEELASPARDDQAHAIRAGRLSLVEKADVVMAALRPNLVLLAGLCFAMGSCAYAIVQPQKIVAISGYTLDWADRIWAAISSVLGTAVVLVAAALWLRRAARGGITFDSAVTRLNQYAFAALALPLLIHVLPPGIETRSMPSTLLIIVIITVILGVAVAVMPETVSEWVRAQTDRVTGGLRRLLFGAGVAGLFLFVGAFFSWRGINVHHAFGTSVFDLGLYDNIFFQSWNGNFLGCTFMALGVHYSAHFDPVLVLLSPLYALSPSSETVIVLQSFWMGSAVIPVALLCRFTTGSRGIGFVLAFSLAVYPAAHGVMLYDFHSLALITPVILWVVLGAVKEHWILYWVSVGMACLVREDIPLLLCATSFAIILAGGRSRRRHGALTIVVALTYFAFVKLFVMISPDLLNCSDGGVCFAYYFKDLIVADKGGIEIIFSLVSHPGHVLEVATREPKLIFLAQVFVPLAFIPLFARSWRWMMGYGVLFALLASKTAVFSIAFQYVALIFPVAFGAAAVALGEVRQGRLFRNRFLSAHRTTIVLATAIVVASTLATVKYGGIIPNQGFKAGWGHPPWRASDTQRDDHEWLVEQRAKIGPTARVTTSDKLAPHFSARMHAFRFGFQSDKKTDFIIVHERDFRKKKHRKRKRMFEKMKADTERYEVFAQRGKMWILKAK